MLTERGINIATMQLYRDHPGGNAVMIIETDKAVPPDGLRGWNAARHHARDVHRRGAEE